ncbi:MAG: hypothetical protein ACRDVG_15780 [Jatrophihabitantaceae bacterium]
MTGSFRRDAGGADAGFDARLRDMLQAAAATTRADQHLVERLIAGRHTRVASLTLVARHRVWLPPC